MPDLGQLYQEVILDHNKKPRNFGKLEQANRQAEGFNPLCGDKITLYLKVEDGVVKDIRFQGSGCAISTASASMMTTSVKGKTVAEAEALFEKFHQMVTGKQPALGAELGKLAVFSGVSEFPVRVKCATLAWHTFHAALQGKNEPVSTE
jgi:nitrogen fixation NifU-like protein